MVATKDISDTTLQEKKHLWYSGIKIIIIFQKYTVMANISICDFEFQCAGYGHYKVTYTSPKTNKSWSKTIDDMTLIDSTKNTDEPLVKNLNALKRKVKSI
jgi:hypothetical protein